MREVKFGLLEFIDEVYNINFIDEVYNINFILYSKHDIVFVFVLDYLLYLSFIKPGYSR